jgi:hypothetical protein
MSPLFLVAVTEHRVVRPSFIALRFTNQANRALGLYGPPTSNIPGAHTCRDATGAPVKRTSKCRRAVGRVTARRATGVRYLMESQFECIYYDRGPLRAVGDFTAEKRHESH